MDLLKRLARPDVAAKPPVSLSARLGLTNAALPSGFVQVAAPESRSRFGRPAVSWSEDVARVINLPRRKVSAEEQAEMARHWTATLRWDSGKPCDCVSKWGKCIRELLPIQGWALHEISKLGGILAPIGVGHGKTGVDILAAMAAESRMAVLLVPAQLRRQFDRDFAQWSAHFRTPNLAGGRAFVSGRPVLHVYSYNELSLPKNTGLLAQLKPDLIIADEAQSLKDRTSSRTKRFLRHFDADAAEDPTGFAALSGSMTTKSLKDYAHLSQHALREGSPLPTHWPAVEDWAGAIDPEPPAGFRSPCGALAKLCHPGEDVRAGFARRLTETPGVISTEDAALMIPLVISKRDPPPMPEAVRLAIEGIRRDWERPDGEALVEGLDVANCARQAACGFFYRWIWPHGEPEEVILEWLAARKAWNSEMRERLKRSGEGLDSPGLLEDAAARHLDGYEGEKPVWSSDTFERWRDVRGKAKPETETIWIDEYLARDAADWACSKPGIVWYEHTAFGVAVERISGLPRYGGGKDANSLILEEKGDRSIIASIKPHHFGKNLQAFHRNLIVPPPGEAGVWEQLLGRTHRPYQPAGEVFASLYLHTPEMILSWERALHRAEYIEESILNSQKLNHARLTF